MLANGLPINRAIGYFFNIEGRAVLEATKAPRYSLPGPQSADFGLDEQLHVHSKSEVVLTAVRSGLIS